MNIFLIVTFIATSVFLVVSAGRVQSFLEVGAMGIGLMLIFLIHIFFFFKVVFLLVKGKLIFHKKRSSQLLIASLVILYLSVFYRFYVNNNAVIEMKRRGDLIYNEVIAFKKRQGKLPEKLEELGVGIPQPVLKGSKFRYSNYNGFTISFPSIGWLVCRRSEGAKSWVCND